MHPWSFLYVRNDLSLLVYILWYGLEERLLPSETEMIKENKSNFPPRTFPESYFVLCSTNFAEILVEDCRKGANNQQKRQNNQ